MVKHLVSVPSIKKITTFSVTKDSADRMDIIVRDIILKAEARAKANDRRRIMARDL